MNLEKVNFFDDAGYKRTRTPVKKFNAKRDYSHLVAEFVAACIKNNFAAISPENVIDSEMPPLIVAGTGNNEHLAMLNPQIVRQRGKQIDAEACGNFFLSGKDGDVHPLVVTVRPGFITFSYTDLEGNNKRITFDQTRPYGNNNPAMASYVTHEWDHTQGRTIIDHARDILIQQLAVLADPSPTFRKYRMKFPDSTPEEFAKKLIEEMPYVLLREGNKYVARLGLEFQGEMPPEVSQDAVYFKLLPIGEGLLELKVPREGEKLSIKASQELTAALED